MIPRLPEAQSIRFENRKTSIHDHGSRSLHLSTVHLSSSLSFPSKSKVLFRRHNPHRVGVAPTTSPPLDTNHPVALVEHAELDTLQDTPLEPVVHVLLPVRLGEVGLRVGEQEGIDATVQVRVLLS